MTLTLVSQSSSRREICERRTAVARNEYILSLATANAHMTRYFCKDLQEIMSVSWFLCYSITNKCMHILILQKEWPKDSGLCLEVLNNRDLPNYFFFLALTFLQGVACSITSFHWFCNCFYTDSRRGFVWPNEGIPHYSWPSWSRCK